MPIPDLSRSYLTFKVGPDFDINCLKNMKIELLTDQPFNMDDFLQNLRKREGDPQQKSKLKKNKRRKKQKN
jgi:hypothetical protein